MTFSSANYKLHSKKIEQISVRIQLAVAGTCENLTIGENSSLL